MSPSPREPEFDLDEDLFDFAAVAQDAESAPESEEDLEEILASFREGPAEELLSVPVVGGAPTVEPAARREPPRAAPVVEPAVTVAPAAAPRAAPPAETAEVRVAPAAAPAAQRARLSFLRSSSGVIAIALSVTVLNSLLAVVMLRARGPSDEVRAVASHTAEEPSTPIAPEIALPEPEHAQALHDHPSLQTAREELARGEYGAARQRVYALLSVIDRLEDPRREELEGECKFLVAQSLHLEALARLGRTE